MRDTVDLHTHTIASGHAYNTIQEMVAAAAAKGIELLGITEHAPSMPGTCHEFYFSNLKILPREQNGIRVLFGAELNILNSGEVDLPEHILNQMDVCIASLHPPCFTAGTVKDNTSAVIRALNNPHVNILGHPDDGRIPLDYEAVVSACAKQHVMVEVNHCSMAPGAFREGAWENNRKILALCDSYRVPVIMGSDAHSSFAVGVHDCALKAIEASGISKELVMNGSPERVLEYIKMRSNR